MSKEFDEFMANVPQQNDVNVGYGDRIYYPNNDVREDDVEKLAEEFLIRNGCTRMDCDGDICDFFQHVQPKDLIEFAKQMELKAKENTYTEEQVREIAKFTISQWTSLNEQREYDHKDLVDVWLDNDLCDFIQSLKQPK